MTEIHLSVRAGLKASLGQHSCNTAVSEKNNDILGCTLRFSTKISNVVTQKIRQCCILRNAFAFMNYDTAWFVCLLGQTPFSTQANCLQTEFEPRIS